MERGRVVLSGVGIVMMLVHARILFVVRSRRRGLPKFERKRRESVGFALKNLVGRGVSLVLFFFFVRPVGENVQMPRERWKIGRR